MRSFQRGSRALFSSLAESRKNSAEKSGNPSSLLAWFDSYIGEGFVTVPIARNLIGSAARTDGPGTLEWLEARADRMPPQQADASFRMLAYEWHKQNAGQFVTWMDANPEHPQHDEMAQSAADYAALYYSSLNEARTWAALIRDPAKRAETEQKIKEIEAFHSQIHQAAS